MTTVLPRAVGAFVVTNIDDIVVLALFFARAGQDRRAKARIVAGQYLGFLVVLGLSITGAGAATLLPRSVLPYLGLLPVLLGVLAGLRAWQDHLGRRTANARDDGSTAAESERQQISGPPPPGIWLIASVTVANGGDNIAVYAPILSVAPVPDIAAYTVVFLVGVGLWCIAGQLVVGRPAIAGFLDRWGHVIFPIGLIVIGLAILTGG